MYGRHQVQVIIQVSKPLSGSHSGARRSPLSLSLSLSQTDMHTHTHQHNFQLQHRDLPRDNSTSIHQERFYKVRSKTSEPTANYKRTTSWPLASSLRAQFGARLNGLLGSPKNFPIRRAARQWQAAKSCLCAAFVCGQGALVEAVLR